MRREKIVEALRRLEEPPRGGRLRRALDAARARLEDRPLRPRLRAAWGAARAHPQLVLAVAVVAGVAVMVLHWS